MRRQMSFRMMFILCLTCLLFSLAVADSALTRYVISPNGATVNMRSGPGTKYSVVTRIKSGSEVEYVETEDGWCLVRYKGKSGYVDASFIQVSLPQKATNTPKPTSTPKVTSAPTLAYITSTNGKPVNLRSGAGRSYNAVGIAEVGKTVTVLEKGKTWSKISVDGQVCFVMTSFLSSTKPTITAAPEATSKPTTKSGTTSYITSTNGNPVRVRKGPGTSYSVIGELPYGTEVVRDGTYNTWAHIVSGDVSGYVMTRYLTTTKPAALTPTPAPTVKATATPKAILSETAWIVSGNGKAVNVRKSASSSGKVLTTLEYGTKVTVTEKGKSWSAVKGSFGTGYVMNTYLTFTEPEPYATPEPSFKSFTVYVYSSNGKSVRIRKGPGSSYDTVTTLDVGTALTVIGESGSWYHVQADGKSGYIMKIYTSEVKPATKDEQAMTPSWVPNAGSTVYIASTSAKVVRVYTTAGGQTADGKSYPAGTPVKVVSSGNGWVKFTVSGTTAYLPIENLAATGASAIPASTNRLVYYLTGTGSTVNVRRAKQSDSDTIGSFITGTAVIVMSRNTEEDWAYIQVGNAKGYVNLGSLKLKP